MTIKSISQAMRSVYPDYVVKSRYGAAAVDELASEDDKPDDAGVQGFEDIELLLADYLPEASGPEDQFEEVEIAEVLATTWKERRAEISTLQKQRKFTAARDLKKSFRVEIEELKKKTKCHRCGRTGHWSRECRQRPNAGKGGSMSSSSMSVSTGNKGSGKESGAAFVANDGLMVLSTSHTLWLLLR